MLAASALWLAGCTKQEAGGPGQMPPPQVVVAEARTQRVAETLSRVANVQANEMVDIRSEIEGVVEEIHFEEGQRVKKGDPLVTLDQTKLAASLAQTEANFQLSKANFERSRQLYEDKLISQQEFDQSAAAYQANVANLDLTRRLLKDARIIAPFDGIVSVRNISPGQVISKNTIVSWLIDLDPVKIEFQIPERFLGQVKEEQTIDVQVAAYPEETFTGQVFFVSPYVDATNRTALVKARIPNPDLKLKPGMFANLDLTLTIREESVVIPEAAITQILTNNQAVIFEVDQQNIARMKTIKTGVRLVGAVEVLEGLQPGDRVIIEGLQKVVPDVAVRLAGAQPTPGAPRPTPEQKAAGE